LALFVVPSLALAQIPRTPSESVTVTGTRSREVLHGFVQSFAAPARLTGKIARWMDGTCPVTVGVPPAFVTFINRRLKEIAVQVGAPVNNSASCRANIAIVFTPRPQTLADDILKRKPALLGYADNHEQEKKLATIIRPIQAWYMTATRDVHGSLLVDNAKPAGLINRMELPCDICPAGVLVVYPPKVVTTTGSRLGDGLRSELYNVIIVADPTKLAGTEMGPLADYVALLALAQLESLDTCQQLTSIVNMLAQNCEKRSDALTENDVAYLHGLYKMSPDSMLGIQMDQVSYQMERDLTGR
jgi:hypothetical protein